MTRGKNMQVTQGKSQNCKTTWTSLLAQNEINIHKAIYDSPESSCNVSPEVYNIICSIVEIYKLMAMQYIFLIFKQLEYFYFRGP